MNIEEVPRKNVLDAETSVWSWKLHNIIIQKGLFVKVITWAVSKTLDPLQEIGMFGLLCLVSQSVWNSSEEDIFTFIQSSYIDFNASHYFNLHIQGSMIFNSWFWHNTKTSNSLANKFIFCFSSASQHLICFALILSKDNILFLKWKGVIMKCIFYI